jgi:hypothetical protein
VGLRFWGQTAILPQLFSSKRGPSVLINKNIVILNTFQARNVLKDSKYISFGMTYDYLGSAVVEKVPKAADEFQKLFTLVENLNKEGDAAFGLLVRVNNYHYGHRSTLLY